MREKSEQKTRLSLSEIPATADQQLEDVEFQVLRVGEFYDARYGKFSITEELLGSLKENFESGVLGVDVALDINHEPEKGAYAWVQSLAVRNGGLWAKFKDFTEEAKRMFREKVYKYFSVEFAPFETVRDGNKVTVKNVLRGIAFTNRPVIKNMRPTFLAEGSDNSMANSRDMNAVKVFAEHAMQRGKVTKDDVAALKLMVAALSEEEQESVKDDVAKVEAEADKAEAEAKADAEKKAEGDGKQDDGKAAEPAEVQAAEVSSLKVQLAEKDRKLAEYAEKEAKAKLTEFVGGLTLSESNLTGFAADQAAEVGEFAKSLSEEQRAKFSELVKSVRTVDKQMLSELGSGKPGDDAKDEDAKLAEAAMLAEKYQKEGMVAHEAIEKAQREIFSKK